MPVSSDEMSRGETDGTKEPVPDPDLDPRLRDLVLAIYREPDQHRSFMDVKVPLPAGLSEFLANLSEWAHREVTGASGFDALTAEQQELLRAVQFLIDRVLLASGGDHYRGLGLSAEASSAAIHENYRNLRRLLGAADPEGASHATVMRISEAYVILRDPARRRSYDRAVLGQVGLSFSAEEAEGGGLDGIAPPRRGRAREPAKRRSGVLVWLGLLVIAAGVGGGWWWSQSIAPPVSTVSPVTAPVTERPEQTPPSEVAELPVLEAESAAPPAAVAVADVPAEDAATGPSGVPEASNRPESEVVAPEPATSLAVAKLESPEPPAAVGEASTAGEASTQQGVPAHTAAPEQPDQPSSVSLPVEALLARADRQLEAGQLTTPQGDNAAETYRQVLAIEPASATAKAGLAKIADRYAMLARFRLGRGELKEAGDMISRGLMIGPTHAQLLDAKAQLDRRQAEELAARREAAPPIAVEASQSADAAAGSAEDLSSLPALSAAVIVPAPVAAPVAQAPPSVKPPPAPAKAAPALAIATPENVAAPVAEAPGPLSDQALDGLISRFVRSYEAGDLESFMALFAEDARSNNTSTRRAIERDYRNLFERSERRLMRLKNFHWSRDSAGEEVVGEADFNLSIFGRRESRPDAYEGQITFRVEEVDGRPLIKGLFHAQRQLEVP
jgi:hypothetical protein